MDRRKPIHIISINCGGSWATLEATLRTVELRYSGHLESLLFAIQEVPYGPVGVGRSKTRAEGDVQHGSLLIQRFKWFFPADDHPQVAWCIPKRMRTTHHVQDDIGGQGIHISITGTPDIHLYNWYCPPGPQTHAQAWPAIHRFWTRHAYPNNSIICGDFNASPPWWDADSEMRVRTRENIDRTAFFQRWLGDHPEVRVADDPTVSTFRAHNTAGTHPDAILFKGPDIPPLELTWTALPITGITMGHTINTVSLQYHLSTVPRDTLLLPHSLLDKWAKTFADLVPADFWHTIWRTAADLDTWVQALFEYSQQATQALTKPTQLKAFVWWWNDQSDEIMRSNRPDKLYRLLQQRRNAYADVREDVTAQGIWRHHRTGAPRKATHIPPLREPFPATHHVEISEAFRQHYFPRVEGAAAEPLPPHLTPPAVLTEEDLWDAYHGMPANVSPGISGMSTRMLGSLLEEWARPFARFFNRCLQLGHYPAPLKRTIVAMVKKPKPYDPTSPRAYRPICVEESLAKLFERVLTLKLQDYTAHGTYFLPIQHGGRPGASVYSAWHDLYSHLLATGDRAIGFVTFDIKGYFDNVDHRQLRQALLAHGVPPYFIQLIEAFATDRPIRFAFNGDFSQWFVKSNRGVPQGSPISPLLANMAAMPVLHRLQDLPWLRLYMDDGGIVESARTPAELLQRLQDSLRRVGEAFAHTSLTIDPGSIQFISFQRRRGNRGRYTAPLRTPLVYQDLRIQPSLSITWLGIRIDKNLSFAPHVKSRVIAGKSTWASLEWLTNRSRGMRATNMRAYYLQILRPVLFWGVPLWHTRESQLAALLRPIHRRALLSCGGFLKLTPTATMEALLSIPPIEHYAAVEAASRNLGVIANNVTHTLRPAYRAELWSNDPISPAMCTRKPELERRATIITEYGRTLNMPGLRFELRHNEEEGWIMVYQSDRPFPPTILFTLRFTPHTDLLSRYLIAFYRILRHIRIMDGVNPIYSVYIVSSYRPSLQILQRTTDSYTRHFVYLISHFLPTLRRTQVIFTYTPLRLYDSPRDPPEDFIEIPLTTVPGGTAHLRVSFVTRWKQLAREWVDTQHHTMTTPWRRELIANPSYDLLPPLRWPWTRRQEVRYLQTVANVSYTGKTLSRYSRDHQPNCPLDNQLDSVDHRLTTCEQWADLRYHHYYRRILTSPDTALRFEDAKGCAEFFDKLYEPP